MADKPVRRTKFGLTLVRHPHTWWRTEDDRFEIGEAREITTCEAPHPVPIGREAVEWARANTYQPLARTILDAVSRGKKGYMCEGFTEHDRACGWEVYHADNTGGGDELFPTLTEAWAWLAAKLAKEGDLR